MQTVCSNLQRQLGEIFRLQTLQLLLPAQDFAASVRQLGCDLEKWPEEQRQRALQMLVHACDIGNPAKSLHSSLLWSERILAENFAQVGTCPWPHASKAPILHDWAIPTVDGPAPRVLVPFHRC